MANLEIQCWANEFEADEEGEFQIGGFHLGRKGQINFDPDWADYTFARIATHSDPQTWIGWETNTETGLSMVYAPITDIGGALHRAKSMTHNLKRVHVVHSEVSNRVLYLTIWWYE